jgi:PhoPQ-activated pathogenicity-related protein
MTMKSNWLAFFSFFLFIYPVIKTYSIPLNIKNCEDTHYLLQYPHKVLPCAEKILAKRSIQPIYLGKEKTKVYIKYTYSFESISWPKFLQTTNIDVYDFFPPDSSHYYYNALSEKKLLFYLPNSGHYIEYSPSVSQLASAVSAFYKRIISHQALPIITWQKSSPNELKIHYSEQPSRIVLWAAKNPITRDFRYSCAVHYQPTDLMAGKKEIILTIPESNQGWSASFIELDFPDGLSTSTPIFIFPDTYPRKNQIMSSQGMCLLIKTEDSN